MASPEHQDMFYRANVATQLLGHAIAPEHIADALTRANQIITNITFGYAIIDKPEHGFNMHFIITPVNGDQLPGDGYNWLDDEVSATHQVDPTRFLIVHERRQGVAPGDQCISMTRRRYELLQNNQRGQIQFIHYLAADQAVRSTPINPGAPIKMPARRIPFPTYDQMQQQQEQPPKQQQPISRPTMPQSGPPLKFTGTGVRPAHSSTASGPTASTTNAPTKRPASSASTNLTSPPPSSRRKSGHPAGAAQQPDRDSYLYDESPQATGRDIAVVRFTRNHEWLEQLWNPSTALKPNATSLALGEGKVATEEDKLETQSKQLAKTQSRLAALRAEVNTLEHCAHHETLPGFPGPVRKWVAEMDSLTSVEVWSAYVQDVVNVRALEHGFDPIVPYVPVRAVTLSKALKDAEIGDEGDVSSMASSAMDVDSEMTGMSSVAESASSAGVEEREDDVGQQEPATDPQSANVTDGGVDGAIKGMDVQKVKGMDASGAGEDNSSLGSELDDLLGVPMEQRHHRRQPDEEPEQQLELTDVHMSDLDSSVAGTSSSSATGGGGHAE